MAVQQLAIRSERELDQVVLIAEEANVDGNINISATLPAGFGDCYLLRVGVNVSAIATMMVDPQNFGPHLRLIDVAAGTVQHMLSAERWTRSFTLQLASVFEPYREALWRDGEQLQILADEVDTNVVPTADVQVYVLVQRRRNIGSVRRAGRGALAV